MVSVPEGCPSTSTIPVPLKPPTSQSDLSPVSSTLVDPSIPSEEISSSKPLVTQPVSLEKKKRSLLTVKQVTPDELFKIKFHCLKCPEDSLKEYSLSEFFHHEYSVHKVISCFYCDEEFHYAREIMVHLHREHRLNNQKFESDEEFLRRGGGRATVVCVECNSIFQLSAETDPNILSHHDCRKPPACLTCGLILDNVSQNEHSSVCKRGLVSKPLEQEICKFCKRKLQHKADGHPVCPFCERIGIQNLVVKLSPPVVKTNLQNPSLNQLPAIPQLSLSSTRKTTKALPPLLPANFGKTTHANSGNNCKDSPVERNKKATVGNTAKLQAPKPRDGLGQISPAYNTELHHLNFSSSITVTPLNPASGSQSNAQEESVGANQKSNHSILSQENTDLPRPKRSLKRVTREDFMYENQLKRRISTPTVSITPLPLKAGQEMQMGSKMTSTPTPQRSRETTPLFDESNGVIDTEDTLISKEEVPEVKLDPLLLEPDSKKRIELLIKELALTLLNGSRNRVRNIGLEPIEGEPYSILLSERDVLEDSILSSMIEKSSVDCDYCRQVKLIRIDKRQLVLHLFRTHDWVIRLNRRKITIGELQKLEMKESSCTKQVKVNSDDSEGINVKIEMNESEVHKEDLVKPKYDDGKVHGELVHVNGESKSESTSEKVKSSTNSDDAEEILKECKDRKDENLYKVEKNEHDKDLERIEKPENIENLQKTVKLGSEGENKLVEIEKASQVENFEKIEKIDAELITKDIHLSSLSCMGEIGEPKEEVCEVNLEEFYLEILRKVFHSENLVFTFISKEKVEFGEIPCECLICGFSASSQIALFPHWRKAHRGMGMKCPMCLGNFLFAGALFSHICLGTPHHFVRTTSGGKVGSGGGPEGINSEAPVNGMSVEGGTSHDTIALRYQCGICDNRQLPGFFNYMVHLRRDHHKCELCLETLQNEKELEHHMKKHKLNHFCWKCSIAYLSKPNFMTHLFWKHGTESQECSTCLKKKWPHIYHFCIPPPWFTCDVCGLYFTKPKAIIVHKRFHTGEKLRDCSECSQKFVSASLLRKHMATEHQISNSVKAILSPRAENKLNGYESEESQGGDEMEQPIIDSKSPKIEELKGDKVRLDTLEETVKKDDGKSGVLVPNDTTTSDSERNGLDAGKVGEQGQLDTPTESKQLGEISGAEVKSNTGDVQAVESTPSREKDNSKKSKGKRRKDPKFKLDKILGPNLSEDEGSGDSSSSSSSEDEKDEKDGSSSDSSSSVTELSKEPETRVTTPPPDETDSPKPNEFVVPSTLATPVTFKTPTSRVYIPVESLPMVRQSGDFPGATPRLDLSSTATASLFDEKSILEQPLSPLLHPLDEFNLSVPEIPTFEENSLPDHISRENALSSILNEHDYCIPPHHLARHKRKSPYDFMLIPDDRKPVETGRKKLKILKPQSKSSSGKKRKRNHSSSSSSSSSSCSSCGPNCSCSSGSSSSSTTNTDDSSDSSDSDSNSDTLEQLKKAKTFIPATNKVPPSVKPIVFPSPNRRGRKPKIPKVEEYPKIKKPKGRPPKGSKKPKVLEYRQPTRENGLGIREVEILKHFANPDDAFVLEEDLDTTDSDSDELFHKKQLTESIISVPPLIDEAWTAGNEKFLLKAVKGVEELEELRPKPQLIKKKINAQPLLTPVLKPLIVRRSFGNVENLLNENDPNVSVMIGNTQITGKGTLQTSLSTNANHTTITISRGVVTAATALPASALVKGVKGSKMKRSGTVGPKPSTSTGTSGISTSSPILISPSITSPKHNTTNPIPLNNSESPLSKISPCGPGKVRRARMKITEIKKKIVVPLEMVEEKEPNEMLYCICQGPHDNVSEMIGCDAKDCPYQWFHFECVGIVVAPKGKWYCPDCKDNRRRKALQIKKTEGPAGIGGESKSPVIISNKPQERSSRPRGYMNNTFIGHTVS